MIQASSMLCPLVRCVGWSPVASLRPLPTIHGSTPYWQRTLPTPAEAAASGAVALQEVEDGVVEDLVAIAGPHVARAGDVCVLGVRPPPQALAWTSVVEGKRVSVGCGRGGPRMIKNKLKQ